MDFWNNTITLYSKCGDSYVRTGAFEGCFWKREDSLLYEEGRKRVCRSFTARIPHACFIEPGDVLALGNMTEELTGDFMARHAGEAFEVTQVAISAGSPAVTRCGGVNIG